MHTRQKIKERAAVVLTGLPTTGTNVFQSRLYRLDPQEMSGLIVTTGDEELDEDSLIKGPTGIISMILSIKCIVEENDDYDDELDLILKEVQAAMKAERSNSGAGSLPSLCQFYYYLGLEDVEYDAGETDAGAQSINYIFQYVQEL